VSRPPTADGAVGSLHTRIIESVPEVVFATDADGCWTYLNPAWTRLTGHPAGDCIGRSFTEFVFGEERAVAVARFGEFMLGQVSSYRREVPYRTANGAVLWLDVNVSLDRDADGRVTGSYGSMSDITARKQADLSARGEQAILEAIIGGDPLESVLSGICRLSEDLAARSRCSILSLDPATKRLHVVAAPSLPDDYNALVDGTAIGPCAGSCGTAAFRGEPVVVADIANDPLWVRNGRYHASALNHGLRACWSFPIVGDGVVLGTFAIYYDRVREPDGAELRMADRLAKLAAIAIMRRRTDDALRISEERYAVAVRGARVGIWDVDLKAGSVYWSPLHKEMLGLDPDAAHTSETGKGILGQTLESLIHPDDLPQVERAYLSHLAHATPYDVTFRVIRPDGALRWMQSRAQAVRDDAGAPVRIAGSILDVTDKVDAADALRTRERQLSKAQSFARTGDWLWHLEQRRVEWSDEIYRIFGVDRDSYVPDIGSVFDFVHPDDRPEVIDRMSRTIADKSRTTMEFRIERRDGEERHLWAQWQCSLNAAGEVSHVFGVSRDVTEEKKAAEALRAAKDAAEAASRAKSEFLASMSHELRTPLNAIMGFSEVLKEGILGPLSERYRDYASDIHRSGRHLLDLISDLLNMARIEARQIEFNEESVALADIVEEGLRLTRLTPGEAAQMVTVTLPDPVPIIQADRRALKQVLINLLGNAAKFTPDDGRIGVAVGFDATGEHLEIKISDTGIGVPEHRLGDLGKPFSRVENVMSRRYQGSGMGLFISKALVERHGGALLITSAEGRGTSVTVRLPANRIITFGSLSDD
jgi:two-component system cell cycle sensor histidine kinase PleC